MGGGVDYAAKKANTVKKTKLASCQRFLCVNYCQVVGH